jgi:hypothetical protein
MRVINLMVEYPFEANIKWAREHYLNWDEVEPLMPDIDNLWPRAGNGITLLKSGRQIVYTARAEAVFVGPSYEKDWREYLTDIYAPKGKLIYTADRKPYDKIGEAAWLKYCTDSTAPGIKAYYPETGEERPAGELDYTIGHYGDNYISTAESLKGRGITLIDDNWDGHGRKQYRVTDRALDKLKRQYSIVCRLYL